MSPDFQIIRAFLRLIEKRPCETTKLLPPIHKHKRLERMLEEVEVVELFSNTTPTPF